MHSLLERLLAKSREHCVDEGWDVAKVEELSRSWLQVFLDNGYVGLTCREALEQPDYLWLSFFLELSRHRHVVERPSSPVSHRLNSSWMHEFDYCFLNVRATSLQESSTGTFINAIKLLPVLRIKGIHLAPFFDCNFGNVYSIDSLTMPYPKVIDQSLCAEGVSPDDQVRFFVDMAHLCGMVVGFDLEPHTSQFSRVVLDHPHLFRWVRLNKERTATVPADQKTMHSRKTQEEIIQEVRTIVFSELKTEGLESFERVHASFEQVRRAHQSALKRLIDQGLWTLPCGTWGGVGLPRFKEYNHDGNYPVFEYRNAYGEDHAEHAFGMLTPFRFYDNLPICELPGGGYLVKEKDTSTLPDGTATEKPRTVAAAERPVVVDEVVNWFAEVFPRVRDRYGFDFVRLDYVDHVFDAVLDEDRTVPISDRCIPTVLEKVLKAARREAPWVGAMAERMGMDVRNYGDVGFDLLLGIDILTPMHSEALSGILSFSREVGEQKAVAETMCSVQWSVDTHDSGNPLFWGRPISEVVGTDGLLLRKFVGRFATPGILRRPLYECMGNHDMSHGLFRCNNRNESLSWVGDRDHARRYHAIDDAAQRFVRLLREGWASWWMPEEDWFAWAVDTHQGDDGWRGRLVCVIATERKYETLTQAAEDSIPLPVVPSIEIDVGREWDRPVREVHEVLLDGSGFERPVPLIRGHRIKTSGLCPRSYRLYLVRG